MEHGDAVYGSGSLFASTKLPSCYILKTLRVLSSEEQFGLFSQVENTQNIYLISLYGYSFARNCEC